MEKYKKAASYIKLYFYYKHRENQLDVKEFLIHTPVGDFNQENINYLVENSVIFKLQQGWGLTKTPGTNMLKWTQLKLVLDAKASELARGGHAYPSLNESLTYHRTRLLERDNTTKFGDLIALVKAKAKELGVPSSEELNEFWEAFKLDLSESERVWLG